MGNQQGIGGTRCARAVGLTVWGVETLSEQRKINSGSGLREP